MESWKNVFRQSLKELSKDENYFDSNGVGRLEAWYDDLDKFSEMGLFSDADDSIRKYARCGAPLDVAVFQCMQEIRDSFEPPFVLGDRETQAPWLSSSCTTKLVEREVRRRIRKYRFYLLSENAF